MPADLSSSDAEAVVRKVHEMERANSNLETEEGRMAGFNLRPTAADVMIVSPPKTGVSVCVHWACWQEEKPLTAPAPPPWPAQEQRGFVKLCTCSARGETCRLRRLTWSSRALR